MRFERITLSPTRWGCLLRPWLRIPVATVVGMVAERMSVEEIVGAHSDLEAGDITEALSTRARAPPSPRRVRRLPVERDQSRGELQCAPVAERQALRLRRSGLRAARGGFLRGTPRCRPRPER